MTQCTQCGKQIITRNISQSPVKNVRWEYWNYIKKWLEKIDNTKDENKKKELKLQMEEKLKKEYFIDQEILEERQKELLDLHIHGAPEEIMDWIKDAINNYVLEKFVSVISICGTAAEFILEDVINQTSLSKSQKDKIKEPFHRDRLLICKFSEIIDEQEYGWFENIRSKRNKYVHPKTWMEATTPEEIESIRLDVKSEAKDNAKLVIRDLILLANKIYSSNN